MIQATICTRSSLQECLRGGHPPRRTPEEGRQESVNVFGRGTSAAPSRRGLQPFSAKFPDQKSTSSGVGHLHFRGAPPCGPSTVRCVARRTRKWLEMLALESVVAGTARRTMPSPITRVSENLSRRNHSRLNPVDGSTKRANVCRAHRLARPSRRAQALRPPLGLGHEFLSRRNACTPLETDRPMRALPKSAALPLRPETLLPASQIPIPNRKTFGRNILTRD